MLREGDELVAVVDWEGCRPGDRGFDLVTFCFAMKLKQLYQVPMFHG
jgi:aminoglycoside phosphotransferase (APT) family kinase protein